MIPEDERMRFLMAMAIVVGLIWPTSLRADDTWQRITCIDDPAVTVTLLLKRTATPAHEEFIGFELHNKTERPLSIGDATGYYLRDVTRRPVGRDGPESWGDLASGSSYDLLYREGNRRRDPTRDDTIPPGITRRLRYSSVYSFAVLGWPATPGLTVSGKVLFNLEIMGRDSLATPREGIAFQFDWLPADDAAIASAQQRLVRVLEFPVDPFGDSFLMHTLLSNPRVASAVTVDQFLDGLKRHDQIERPTIREYINENFATDERVTAFVLDVIRTRDRLLLREIALADRIHDARLVQPLFEWVKSDRDPYHCSHFAMTILKRHWDLIPDSKAMRRELGKMTLARCPFVSNGAYPTQPDYAFRWESEVLDLVLTCDPMLIKHLSPYLERKDVVHDANRVALMNNGVSTRACDTAYNAILDLLDRPGERLLMVTGDVRKLEGGALKDEYARRDALIQKLKAELDRTNQ
jgi:hypothetical protein